MTPTTPGRSAVIYAGRRPRCGRPHSTCQATCWVARAAERFFAWLKGGFRRQALG